MTDLFDFATIIVGGAFGISFALLILIYDRTRKIEQCLKSLTRKERVSQEDQSQ